MRGADFDSPMDTVQLIDGDSSSSSSAEVALRSGEDEAADPQTAFATAKTKCGNRLTPRQLTTLLIMLVTACLFADQNLMAPNMTEIRLEFNMTKEEGDRKLGGHIALMHQFIGPAPQNGP